MIRLSKPYERYEGKWIKNVGKNYREATWFLVKFMSDEREDWEEQKIPKPKFKAIYVSPGTLSSHIVYAQHFSTKATGQDFITPTDLEKRNAIRGIFN